MVLGHPERAAFSDKIGGCWGVGFASGHPFLGAGIGEDNQGTGVDRPLRLQRPKTSGCPGVLVSGAAGSWDSGGVLSGGLWSLQRSPMVRAWPT